MAGLGRRTFVPGEVLTATNVMGYLQDQAVMKFAGTAARGSAIGTAVAEGMVSYLADTDLVEVYNGTAWKQISGTTGNVLQVVQGTTQTQFSTSSTSFVDSTLSATITPKSANSKIFITVSQAGFIYYSGAGAQFGVNIVRNSTEIAMSNSQFNIVGQVPWGSFLQFLDSPATTSAVTYKTQVKVSNASNAFFLQWPPSAGTPISTITLMEIAG